MKEQILLHKFLNNVKNQFEVGDEKQLPKSGF